MGFSQISSRMSEVLATLSETHVVTILHLLVQVEMLGTSTSKMGDMRLVQMATMATPRATLVCFATQHEQSDSVPRGKSAQSEIAI